tara:strand:+ start:14 stop:1495 length:1482 start_codon:yes stop_codon:yes gene_type:complete
MATHDYVLDNATGANFRSDLNNALAAIVSNNSSSTEPSTKYAYQWWADTNEGVLKIRNSSNDGWVTLLQLDGTLTLEDGSASAPALGFRDDLNTGIFSSAADTLDVTCGGTTRGSFSSSGLTVTGNVTATTFVGDVDANNGDFDGTLEADAITVAGVALNTVIAGVASTNVTVADESSDTTCFPLFVTAATGDLPPKSGSNLSFNSSNGTLTATAFSGDGSALTGVGGTTINNNANNRVITGSGSANTLEGESELTYDSGTLNLVPSSGEGRILVIGGEGEDARLTLAADDGDDHIDQYNIEARASDNSFRIDQFSGGSRVDRLSIDTEASGGNVTIHTGNLVIGTSGKGIDFSATTDASGGTSELLDDYEEGTWTPDARDGSLTASKAFYTKIGRQVTLHCRLESFTDTSTNDQLTITGIPFGVNSDGADIAHGSARYQNISETDNTVCFITHARQGFNFSGGDSGTFSQVRHNELNSSSRIDLIATYFVGL